MSEIQALPAWRLAADLFEHRLVERPEGTAPAEPAHASTSAKVTLPSWATTAAHVEDAETQLAVDVRLMGARDVAARMVDRYPGPLDLPSSGSPLGTAVHLVGYDRRLKADFRGRAQA